jgi:cytochrome c2
VGAVVAPTEVILEEATAAPEVEATEVVTEVAVVAPTEAPTEEPVVTATDVPTEAPVLPTDVPTDVPAQVPTETPTLVPTQTPLPTEAVTLVSTTGAAEPTTAAGALGTEAEVFPPTPVANDVTTVLVSVANPARGDELFHTELNTSSGPYMCSTCHYVDSAQSLIGPGLQNIGLRAWTHIEDSGLPYESAAEYLYNSIIHPNEYIVEGYAANIMPQNYGDILSQDDLYNLVAYLFTLDTE